MKCTNTQLTPKCQGEFAPLPGSTKFHECKSCGFRIDAPIETEETELPTPKKAKASTVTDKEN